MKPLLFSVLTLLSLPSIMLAQKEYGPTNDSLYLGFYRDSVEMLGMPTIMVVPFHPDRYMSDIDHQIAKGTSYNYQHTRGFFRKGLDNAILIGGKQYNETVSMHADIPSVNADLAFLYRMTKNPHEVYVQPKVLEDEGFKKRLSVYWEKLQGEVMPKEEPGTRIKEGQLYSVEGQREYITKTEIINDIVIDSIIPKYDADYVLFINHLDMLNAASNQSALEQDDYQRVIIAHMTVLDKEGKALFSLKKKRYFHSEENDLRSIIKDHYLPLGHEIIYALDSYRFLKAGLTPLTEQETELAKNKTKINLPTLQKFK